MRATKGLGLALSALIVAACAEGGLTLPTGDDAIGDSGDGWELVADLEQGPSADTHPVRAAAGDETLSDAWQDFALSGEPPATDHDEEWTLLVSGVAACAGELAEVEVDEGFVRLQPDGEAARCQPGDGTRTFVFAIDRSAVGDGFVRVQGVGDSRRQFATQPTTTPPPQIEDADGLDPRELDAVVGDEIAFEVVDDDVTSLRPEDLQLLAWDGLQWRDVDRPEGVEIQGDPSVGDTQVLVPTDGLEPTSHWVRVFAPGAEPGRVEALLTLRSS